MLVARRASCILLLYLGILRERRESRGSRTLQRIIKTGWGSLGIVTVAVSVLMTPGQVNALLPINKPALARVGLGG